MEVFYDILNFHALGETGKTTYMENWLILRGSGAVFSLPDGQRYAFETGAFLNLLQGISYRLEASPDCLIGRMQVPGVRSTCRVPSIVVERGAQVDALRGFFYLALQLQQAGFSRQEKIDALTDSLINEICMQLLRPSLQKQTNPALQSVFEAIEAHLSEPDFDLSSVIAASNYHPAYLRELFRRQTGYAPHTFLLRRRIVLAKELIAQAGARLNVGEIAMHSGFSDASYFTRQFRSHTGLTPTAYHAQLRAQLDKSAAADGNDAGANTMEEPSDTEAAAFVLSGE